MPKQLVLPDSVWWWSIPVHQRLSPPILSWCGCARPCTFCLHPAHMISTLMSYTSMNGQMPEAEQRKEHILHTLSRVSEYSMTLQLACCLSQRCSWLHIFQTWLTCEQSHLRSAGQVGLLCVQLIGSGGKAVRMWGKSQRLSTGGSGAMCSCLWKLGSKCEEAGK